MRVRLRTRAVPYVTELSTLNALLALVPALVGALVLPQ